MAEDKINNYDDPEWLKEELANVDFDNDDRYYLGGYINSILIADAITDESFPNLYKGKKFFKENIQRLIEEEHDYPGRIISNIREYVRESYVKSGKNITSDAALFEYCDELIADKELRRLALEGIRSYLIDYKRRMDPIVEDLAKCHAKFYKNEQVLNALKNLDWFNWEFIQRTVEDAKQNRVQINLDEDSEYKQLFRGLDYKDASNSLSYEFCKFVLNNFTGEYYRTKSPIELLRVEDRNILPEEYADILKNFSLNPVHAFVLNNYIACIFAPDELKKQSISRIYDWGKSEHERISMMVITYHIRECAREFLRKFES